MKAEWNVRVLRSARKTISMEATAQGLLVRAPLELTAEALETFLERHSRWIESHLAKQRQQEPPEAKLSPEELRELSGRAVALFPGRVAFFAQKLGVNYGRITIRCQHSRWGSCSAKSNLNFNCLLLLAPPEVLDSVVAHELCHRKEMNHSPRFYAEVLRIFPEYRRWESWLKEHGAALLQRLP